MLSTSSRALTGLNDQVLRAVQVGDSHALRQIAGHDQPAGGERLRGRFRARQGGELALHGFGDAAAHVGVRGQQNHLRVRAVFRLRQQVGSDKVRRWRRCRR